MRPGLIRNGYWQSWLIITQCKTFWQLQCSNDLTICSKDKQPLLCLTDCRQVDADGNMYLVLLMM